MDPEFRGSEDHHDGTSDATPGGYAESRRPGEIAFALILMAASLALLIEAYGISGLSKLSAPGSVPVATTGVMVLCMGIVLWQTIRRPRVVGETVARDILPVRVILFVGMLLAYGLLLRPLGFLPTTALFLIGGIRLLGRGWGFSVAVGLLALIGIWLVFRMVFTVLMPPGILPEAEMVQFLRNLFGAAR
jgi:hypothetical protein